MTKIFRASDRRFEQNPGRIDGFRLESDVSITTLMAAVRSGGNSGIGARTLGEGSLNFDIRRLNPGEISGHYHFHHNAEELFMVVEGEATLRTPEGLRVLGKGDIAFFGTGFAGAHQLYNHSAEPCVYLDVRTFSGADLAEYPDSGSLRVIPTLERLEKSASNDYFDGEPDADFLRKIFERR